MNSKIRAIAICIFSCNNKILTFEHFDDVKKLPFHRPIGGGIDYQETSYDAMIREAFEELGSKVTNLILLGVLENIFTYNGQPKHEIVFVYDGEFQDKSMYSNEELIVTEDNGEQFKATWRELGFFDSYQRLVPENLNDLLIQKSVIKS